MSTNVQMAILMNTLDSIMSKICELSSYIVQFSIISADSNFN